MGFYQRFVLPRLLDFSLKNQVAGERRSQLIPQAVGSVVEVGIGSGRNLPFYSAAVTRVVGIEPSTELLAMARPRGQGRRFPVEFVSRPAEQLPLDDRSMDTAVTTWTLCSVADPAAVLRELRRVLKPDGLLLFVEHGLSPDPATQAWQHRLTPLWRRVAGGCRLNLAVDALLGSAGFRIADLRTDYMPGPRPLSYTYQGSAHPA